MGLALVVVGLVLGAAQGKPLGGMVGLLVGLAVVVLGRFMLDVEYKPLL